MEIFIFLLAEMTDSSVLGNPVEWKFWSFRLGEFLLATKPKAAHLTLQKR